MPNPPRPHHLNLACADWQRTAAFYRELLGLTPVELPRDRDAYAPAIATLADAGGYQYHFIPPDLEFTARERLPVNPLGAGHLAFRVDDIAAIRAQLDAAGIPYSDMGEWAIKGWHQLFCADPDGRVIEFHQVIDPEPECAMLDASNIEERHWLRGAAGNPIFDALHDPAEDVYTREDGQPFHDKG